MNAPGGASAQRSGSLVVGLLLAATLVAFTPTLLSYHDVWVRQPYTHGYFLLAATIWILWRERPRLGPESRVHESALPAAAVLSAIWFVGHVTSLQMIAQAVLPLLLLSWVAHALGRQAAERLLLVVALFLLAVPFWDLVTPILQWMTVMATGAALVVLRVPATLEGNVVTVPSGTFLIEDGCAGLNYLLSGLVVGALYGYAFVPRWSTRLAVVSLSAALAIFGNWIRVTALVIIGHMTEMQSSLMEGHLTFGWGIFLVGLVAFFPLTRVLERRSDSRWPAVNGPGPSATNEPRPVIVPWRRVALVSAVVGSGPLVYAGLALLPRTPVPPGELTGSAATGWVLQVGEPAPATTWRPAFPAADEAALDLWTNGSSQVRLDRLVYHGQSQDAELVGFGSRIAPDSALILERLFGQVGPERRLVNEAIVRDGTGHLLVWYWYRVGGVETQSAARAKMLEVWAFLRRATTSELIALSTRCGPTDCADASRTLASFLGTT